MIQCFAPNIEFNLDIKRTAESGFFVVHILTESTMRQSERRHVGAVENQELTLNSFVMCAGITDNEGVRKSSGIKRSSIV